MRRARPLIGPTVVGLAAWCAAGDITVPNGSALVRLAVPAPLWMLAVAVALAALIRPWRRHSLLATPAVLAVLPWLPVPLPVIALMWTGALAWVPIALAVLAAFIGRESRLDFSRRLTPGSHAKAAGALSLVLAALVAWSAAPELPGGDEPHYLVIAQSLLKDGDLRIENNHRQRDYSSYFGGTLAPDYLKRGRDGEIYSIHAPGLAVFVLPAFALFGYRGAQVMVMLAAAGAAAWIWLIAWQATRRLSAAWFAWAAITLSTTFLIQSVMIFPDGPGLLCVAAGAWLVVRLDERDEAPPGVRAIAGVSVMLAALPWLHTRFAVLAGALGVLIVWRLIRPALDGSRRINWSRLLAFASVPAVSALAWFGFFVVIYGTPNPSAPYGVQSDVSARFIPGAVLGLLVDQQYGVLAYAPVLIAAFIGLWGRRAQGEPAGLGAARQLVGIAGLYAAAIGVYWMWWAGQPATPARFLTAALPLAAAAIGRAWLRSDAVAGIAWTVALVAQAGISVVVFSVNRAEMTWNVRDACARWLEWAGPVVSLTRGSPSFFWSLTPAVALSEKPFFVHALVSVLAGGAVVLLAIRLARRTPAPAKSVIVLAGLPLAAMAFIQAGWVLNQSDGLEPVRSQTAVLAASRLQPAWRIAPALLRRVSPTGAFVLRPSRNRLPEFSSAGAVLHNLPGGRYEIRGISRRRVVAGQLAIRIGDFGDPTSPWMRMPWPALSEHVVTIDLPVDVAELRLEPDQALQAAGMTFSVGLTGPLKPPQKPARTAVRWGDVSVWFQGGEVFIEDDGFWVAGGSEADFLITRSDGGTGARVTLGNGGAANTVQVSGGGVDRRVDLSPNQGFEVDVPVSSSGVGIRVASRSGFRPADSGGSDDRRYLGVRVTVR